MVEPIKKSTREQREKWLNEAHQNVFMLKSDYVYIDLLTDSGTGAMSDRQWAAMMMGDESYGGARSFYHMKDTITELTGFDYVIPTHQGRAAENVLFSYLVKPGMIVPGNAHFDTTKGHIESRKAFAIDVTVREAYDTQLEVPFKGNVDLEKLEKILQENKGNVPFMVLTVTNNTVGGQPVSMKNIRETCELCHKYGVPVNVDSARFIENAYFIKTREEGYADKTLREICKEMFSYADSMTMSAKKDGLVNMGGFIATNKKEWYEGAKMFCIPFEGFLTYGGMNGRDMDALAVGLKENIEFEMVETRIKQVHYLAAKLDEYGIPYQRPAGGHAIFVDADKVLLRDWLRPGRPRPRDPREPLRWQRLRPPLHPAPRLHQQPHGRHRRCPEERLRPPQRNQTRSRNHLGSRTDAPLHLPIQASRLIPILIRNTKELGDTTSPNSFFFLCHRE